MREEITPARWGEDGYALIVSMAVLALLGIIVLGALAAASSGSSQAETLQTRQLAQSAAENAIEAAKAELSENGEYVLYNGGSDDSQWSSTKGGKTLTFGATDSSSRVTIAYIGQANGSAEGEFRIKASGTSGGSMIRLRSMAYTTSVIEAEPMILADDSIVIPYGQTLTYDVLGNDSVKDLAWVSNDTSPNSSIATATCSASGDCAIRGVSSGTTTFVYRVRDAYGNTGTATMYVRVLKSPATNAAPDAVNDTPAAILEGEYTAVDVLANDTDPDGAAETEALRVVSYTQPSRGTVECDSGLDCTYTSTTAGTYTFTYTIRDEVGATDTATVTLRVQAPVTTEPPAPPDALDDTDSTGYGQAKYVYPLANDISSDESSLVITSRSVSGTGGTASCDSARCRFTPNSGFSGTARFNYAIRDSLGTDTATVRVTVASPPAVANRAPVARANGYSVVEGQKVKFNVIRDPNSNGDRDSDADGDALEFVNAGSPSRGSVSCPDDSGVCTFSAPLSMGGTSSVFDYRIRDGRGGSDSATVTVTIKNRPQRDLPPDVDKCLARDYAPTVAGSNGTFAKEGDIGGTSAARVSGTSGDDYIRVASTAGIVSGGEGNDLIYVTGRAGSVSGGPGYDVLVVNEVATKVVGEGSDDLICLARSESTISEGGDGADVIHVLNGSASNVYGNGGDDYLYLTGSGLLDGGTGSDLGRKAGGGTVNYQSIERR